jgi:ribosomal protein S18 acetylase RimI-like enzyme
VIRRLRPGDEPLQIELARRFKEHAPTVDQSRAFLTDEHNWLLVASSDDNEPLGFALAYQMARWDGRSMVFFYEIEVAAACRSQGYGRALVEELLRLARASGAYKMWVQTDEVNTPAMRLYESCGATRKSPDDVMWSWTL